MSVAGWDREWLASSMERDRDAGTDRLMHEAALARRVFSVAEAAALLNISVSFAYELIRRDQLPHLRLGRRLVVPVRALDEFILGTAS